MSSLVFEENRSLKELCTLGVGGLSRRFLEVKSVEMMQAAIKTCLSRGWDYLILGKGSNCLFEDHGFDGAVLLNKIDFLKHPAPEIFHVGAGYSFSLLGSQTARLNYAGLEFASGIPASVGGAVFMNAGANGAETQETLIEVDYVDETGELHCLKRDALKFSYRTSPFQKMRGAIVGASFALTPSEKARAKQLEIIRYRQVTQPYKDKSAGCIFRNPPGHYAGRLIEECGLKGYAIRGAKVSEIHANFLINAQDATSQDFAALIAFIQNNVEKKTGIKLESEVWRIPYARVSR